MSVDGVTFLGRYRVEDYEPERAEEIARMYAGRARGERGELLSLTRLWQSDPSFVPEPFVILRWRETIPRFRLLMEEAERCRAVVLLEECVDIADDTGRLAAQARNAMDARMKIAERFDSRRFGTGGRTDGAPIDNTPEALAGMTTAQLMAVAQGALMDGGVAVGVPAIASEASSDQDPARVGGG